MNIREMRLHGWTMEGLASALRVDPSTVFRWQAKGDKLDYPAVLALRWLTQNEKPENWNGKGDRRPQLTYLILDGDTVKIGRSNDPRARLKDLQVGCVRTLKLHMVLDVAEKTVQDTCAAFHVRGEWYRWCPDLQQTLNQFLPRAIPLRTL